MHVASDGHVHSHNVVALLSAQSKLKLSCQKIQPFDLDILQRAVKVHSQEWPRMLAEEYEAGGCGAGRGPPRKPSGPPRVCSLGYSQASDPPRSPTGSPGTIGTFGLLDLQRMAMKHEGGTEVVIWAHVHGTSLWKPPKDPYDHPQSSSLHGASHKVRRGSWGTRCDDHRAAEANPAGLQRPRRAGSAY